MVTSFIKLEFLMMNYIPLFKFNVIVELESLRSSRLERCHNKQEISTLQALNENLRCQYSYLESIYLYSLAI